jgi:hypothetical protein
MFGGTMSADFPYAGTVSHGTHRTVDLVPAFLDMLRALDPNQAQLIEQAYDLDRILSADEEGEEDDCLMDSLRFALNEAAPEGWYFGAIEGDGSDFGFWISDPQGTALARLVEQRGDPVYRNDAPFDLPTGYILVQFSGGFCCGISPEGEVSS